MLADHLNARETLLLANSGVAANAGHSLHKGAPREEFVRTFLRGHLSERLGIGAGEVIDASSRSNPPSDQQRPNFDIVVYRPEFPRLEIGGGVHAFLAESVVATIEVKSTLDSRGIEQAVRAARYAKDLKQNKITIADLGYSPPSILSFVVAYGGPANMATAANWVMQEQQKQGIPHPPFPEDAALRLRTPSPSLDGIYVMGKGFCVYENTRMRLSSDTEKIAHNTGWLAVDIERGSLLWLFLALTNASSALAVAFLNPNPYVAQWKVSQVTII